MLKGEALLLAMNNIPDKYILEADEAVFASSPRRGKLWRTVLIAAVIAALMTAAAYAADWFGLQSMLKGSPMEGSGREMLMLQGLADSPEAMAAAEWHEYRQTHLTDEYDADEAWALSAQYGIYGVTSQTMADKLISLCDIYSLKLLGKALLPESEKDFYTQAGVGKLSKNSDNTENEFRGGYVYPDGTFLMEGALWQTGKDYPWRYQLIRSMKGTLGYVTLAVEQPESYDQWEYSASDGQKMTLANSENHSLILLERENSFTVVNLPHTSVADHRGDGVIDGIGDEDISFTLSRQELESLAEGFNFAALDDPQSRMGDEFTVHRYAAAPVAEPDTDIDLSAVDERDRYYIQQVYTGQIEPYIAGFRLIDYKLLTLSGFTCGWVEFSGTPKTALSWNSVRQGSETVFCRSLNLIADGMGNWSAGESFDMRPYGLLDSKWADLKSENGKIDWKSLPTADNSDIVYTGGSPRRERKPIRSAELYVQQLGKSFTLTGSEKLETLRQTLFNFYMVGGAFGCDYVNPLYVEFEDGERCVFYTLGDGSNACCVDGEWQCYALGVSIFRLFDVPLQAQGYSESGGVLTAHRDAGEDSMLLLWEEYDYEPGGKALARRVKSIGGSGLGNARFSYGESGKLTLMQIYMDDRLTAETLYEYDDAGRLVKERYENFTRYGWGETEYVYDVSGRISAMHCRDNDDPEGFHGGDRYYEYDDLGNCRVYTSDGSREAYLRTP